MHSKFSAAIVAILFSFLCAQSPARGNEFKSDNGYHLQYPNDWQVATKADQAHLSAAVRKIVGNLDSSNIDVVIFDPKSQATRNMNVVIVPGPSVPLNKQGLAEYQPALQQQFASVGIQVHDLECKLAHIGNNDVMTAKWTATYAATKLQQRQIMIPARGRSYIITCTTAGQDVEDDPEFNKIIASFQVDGASLGQWWSSASPPIRFAIIGGGIGLLVGLILHLAKKAAQPQPTKKEPT